MLYIDENLLDYASSDEQLELAKEVLKLLLSKDLTVLEIIEIAELIKVLIIQGRIC